MDRRFRYLSPWGFTAWWFPVQLLPPMDSSIQLTIWSDTRDEHGASAQERYEASLQKKEPIDVVP